jgi:hypothetical protein
LFKLKNPNMKEKATAKRQTKRSCIQVSLIALKMLSRREMLPKINRRVIEYARTSKKQA